MNTSRWLNWKPKEPIFRESPGSEPTKPTEPGFDGFVGLASLETPEIPPLEEVLKGRAVELYLADGDRLFIVADEADAAQLENRGALFTLLPRCAGSFRSLTRAWSRRCTVGSGRLMAAYVSVRVDREAHDQPLNELGETA